jgi:muramoyltetrapeptide carboxypeptidase
MLRPGDRVLLIASRDADPAESTLASWGLDVRRHDPRHGDEELVAALNDALRDPAVRAIVVADQDIGAYRVADRLDLAAAARDSTPVIGLDDVSHLHLALWTAGVGGVHAGIGSDRLREVLLGDEPVTLVSEAGEITAAVRAGGAASGVLVGGSLAALRAGVGAGLPRLAGTVLLLTDKRVLGLGQVDRQLTQLIRSGALAGVRAVAVGRFTGFDGFVDRGWSLVEVLQERLSTLGVPVLGGLPVGLGPASSAAPLGGRATLDADAGTLIVSVSSVDGA